MYRLLSARTSARRLPAAVQEFRISQNGKLSTHRGEGHVVDSCCPGLSQRLSKAGHAGLPDFEADHAASFASPGFARRALFFVTIAIRMAAESLGAITVRPSGASRSSTPCEVAPARRRPSIEALLSLRPGADRSSGCEDRDAPALFQGRTRFPFACLLRYRDIVRESRACLPLADSRCGDQESASAEPMNRLFPELAMRPDLRGGEVWA